MEEKIKELEAKVSEQEKEIEALKEALRQLHLEQDKHKLRHVEIVSEQQKENAALTEEKTNQDVKLVQCYDKIGALTEQVEKLNSHLKIEIDANERLRLAHYNQVKELSRLREERKELVEALKSLHKALNDSDKKYTDWVGTKELYEAFTESQSLLDKFPEDSKL